MSTEHHQKRRRSNTTITPSSHPTVRKKKTPRATAMPPKNKTCPKQPSLQARRSCGRLSRSLYHRPASPSKPDGFLPRPTTRATGCRLRRRPRLRRSPRGPLRGGAPPRRWTRRCRRRARSDGRRRRGGARPVTGTPAGGRSGGARRRRCCRRRRGDAAGARGPAGRAPWGRPRAIPGAPAARR